MKTALSLLLLCLMISVPAAAQDINAYNVPEDISYVRLMNFSNDPAEGYKLNGEEIGTVGFQQIGQYYPVKGYSAKLHHQDIVTEEDIRPGRFYSFIQMDGPKKILFFEENKLLNPNKAFIHFYNLTDRPVLELKSNEGKVFVVLARQGSSGSSDINPFPIKLGVHVNRGLVAEVPELKLEKGKASTIVVIGAEKGLKVITN